MKRVVLVLAVMTSFATFATGCGPEEKYCYDQHTTCKQALVDKAAKEQAERERIERERDAMGIPSDGGAIVLD
jgi:hypothetical protein